MCAVSRNISTSFFLIILGILSGAIGEECVPKSNNPCIFQCNGTSYDISHLFDYPVNVTGTYDYLYTWSPCKGLKCNSLTTEPISAVCQYGVDCGQIVKPVFIVQQHDPFMFRLEYPNGMYWRMSVFQFIEDKARPKTEVTFINEEPMLQYNFVVTGKCIGQPYCQQK